MTIKKYAYNKLFKMGYIYEPRYNVWLSRTYWLPFDAACLFNGVDPYTSHIIELRFNKENTEIEAKRMRYFDKSNGNASNISDDNIKIFNCFLGDVFDESEAIKTWATPPYPLTLINTYLQKIGTIPKHMLKMAKKSFLELYQKINYDEKIKEHWNDNWRNNIAAPFLELLTEKDIYHEDKKPEQSSPDKEPIEQGNSENEKIILEESAEAREIRVRNRGYEVYRLLKEQHPNKKITKETIAEQIIKEEEPLYKLITAKNPLKKQPAFGTYLKELRKIH